MLIREHDDGSLHPWQPSERIAGVMYPPNIEQLWSDDELLAVKLYHFVPFAALADRSIVGAARFEKVGNVVREVYDTQPTVFAAAHVKAEAQRRIIALTGKTNLQDCMIKQFNALMRAGQLMDKRVGGATLTAEEEAEAAALRGLADKIEAIRAASDVIEAMSPIPADYADNTYWPE